MAMVPVVVLLAIGTPIGVLALPRPAQAQVTRPTLSRDVRRAPVSPAPTCHGLPATIYVQNGRIVGGPDHGRRYRGVLRGTSGSDVIVGTEGRDWIKGSGGDDTICGGGGSDIVEGGAGDDWIEGEAGSDLLRGDAGEDVARIRKMAAANPLWGAPSYPLPTPVCPTRPGCLVSGTRRTTTTS